jgi:hypothetical protein
MGIGVSLLLIAGGAILAWAVDANANGVDINTIGYILLIVGIIGFVLSLVFWSTWAGPGYFSRSRRTYSEGTAAPAGGRRTVIEEDSTY